MVWRCQTRLMRLMRCDLDTIPRGCSSDGMAGAPSSPTPHPPRAPSGLMIQAWPCGPKLALWSQTWPCGPKLGPDIAAQVAADAECVCGSCAHTPAPRSQPCEAALPGTSVQMALEGDVCSAEIRDLQVGEQAGTCMHACAHTRPESGFTCWDALALLAGNVCGWHVELIQSMG